MASSALRIGTSGWVYDHWKGKFYPADLPADERLAYYATRFDCVEVNGTFYGLPQRATLRRWAATVPKDFVFAVKMSRYVTHRKKLNVDRASIAKFFHAVEGLGEKLGPVLVQLPPFWKYNRERLAAFLKVLPKAHRYTFEFRNPTWWNEEVYALLREARAALCIFDLHARVSPLETTADFVYVRLHGPTAAAYRGRYPAPVLRRWAERVRAWRAARRRVHVYFDNDEKAFAAADALKLRERLAA